MTGSKIGSRRERRSLLPEVQEELRLREELKKNALPTAAYCRRSVMDTDEDSIENQIAIVHGYIAENPELRLTDTYVDNGISGTSFDRPEWNRMMRDVQNGRISCIVVKDLSRFARDYVEAGAYIEDVFPKLGVRFIAITDNYDNTAGDTIKESIMVPAKNILNDLYARDTGRKQRLIKEKMRMEGRQTKISCPFGYCLKDKKITPDPENAPVVRMMFLWADMGVPILEIAERLTFIGITTKNGCKWDQKQVRELLMNEVFTGTLILGKTSLQNGVRVHVPKDEWRVFPDSHEAIVDRELFDRVQKRLKPGKKSDGADIIRRSASHENVTAEAHGNASDKAQTAGVNPTTNKALPWRGLVICAYCGKPMSVERKHKDALICYRHTGASATQNRLERPPKIRVDEMEAVVYRRCRKLAKDMEKLIVLADNAEKRGGLMERVTKKATTELSRKNQQQNKLEKLYDDYCKGLIDESDYMSLSKQRKMKLDARQDSLNKALSAQRKLKTYVLEIKALWESMDGVKRMSPEAAGDIVESIEVADGLRIDVRFRHQEAIDFMTELAKEEGIWWHTT